MRARNGGVGHAVAEEGTGCRSNPAHAASARHGPAGVRYSSFYAAAMVASLNAGRLSKDPKPCFTYQTEKFSIAFRQRRGRDVDKTVPALGVIDRTEFDSEFLTLARAGFSRSSCLVSPSPLCLPSSRYFMTVSLLRGAVPVRIPAPTTASDRPDSSSVGISRPSHGARRIRQRRPSTLDSGVSDP